MQICSLFLCLSLSLLIQLVNCENATNSQMYRFGFGIADITGPAAENNMMGYAKLSQNTEGIHTRLFSRASIIVDPKSGKRVVFVTAELCSMTYIVKDLVIERLAKLYGPTMYRAENVMLTASHTHSGPGGYFQFFIYLITSEGFQRQSLLAIVNGVVRSIQRAHKNLQPGRITYGEGHLYGANANRSPTAYLNNPAEERAKYEYDTDKLMQVLKFEDATGQPVGLIDWFAVHCTSMNNTNRLISSDNKGYAASRFEHDFIDDASTPLGDRKFVAIFAQANEGDSSPNIMGARCARSGLPCDMDTSTCPEKDVCIASGPGKDMFESTKIIGDIQYTKARELFNKATIPVTGSLEFVYQTVNMSGYHVKLDNGQTVKTCKAALGYSFAAGTTDGEGASYFEQGTTDQHESRIWTLVRNSLTPITSEQLDCQKPKAIFLPVGDMKYPYDWSQEIVPTQIFELGDIVILGVPAEFTTMSGRRIKAEAEKVYRDNGRNVKVILSGLANSYTNYVATYEEYQVQRYEGGSTLFGPHTLDAYRNQYKYLAKNLVQRKNVPNGPQLVNILSKQMTWKPSVIFDGSIGARFGKILLNVKHQYSRGSQVKVKFAGANPRNNLHQEGSFLHVLRRVGNNWKVHATDADWSTKFIWKRLNTLLATSEVTILWNIPLDTPPGVYHIRYFGDAKSLFRMGSLDHFVGKSRPFDVV